jgi:23S rRNA pseudouridine955/2504/2580 synthase
VPDFSRVQVIEVNAAADGQRLDNFLIRVLKGLPKSRIYRLIRKGEVRINKKRCKADDRLSQGDSVRIPPVRLAATSRPVSPSKNLARLLQESIVFSHEEYLIINKPAGLSVHGGSGVSIGLIEALRQMQIDWQQLELVHRLDRDTSGCIVIAKNPLFLKYLNKELKEKNVRKHYLALVHGYWADSLKQVDAPLVKNRLLSGERVVRAQDSGKTALTRFRVIERFNRVATLVEAMPITGRTHQIRVHCQIAGHPIAGDPKYETPARKNASVLSTKLCLHAAKLAFRASAGGEYQEYQAPLNPHFENLLNSLRSQQKS